jgi:hypothetical protein
MLILSWIYNIIICSVVDLFAATIGVMENLGEIEMHAIVAGNCLKGCLPSPIKNPSEIERYSLTSIDL